MASPVRRGVVHRRSFPATGWGGCGARVMPEPWRRQAARRRVVHHGNGRFVAVCGDLEGQCESLELTLDDVVVHELDVGQAWRVRFVGC